MPVTILISNILGRSFQLMVVLLFFMGCPDSTSTERHEEKSTSNNKGIELKIDNPRELPKSLREVSGLHYSEQLGICAINDEKGRIYLLDSVDFSIREKLDFAGKDDYEALTAMNDTFYCLNSGGKLFRIHSQDKDTLALIDQEYIYDLPYGCETEALASNGDDLFTICKTQWLRKDYKLFRITQSASRNFSAEEFMDWTGVLNEFMKAKGYSAFSVHPTELFFDPELKYWVLLSTKPSSLFIIDLQGDLIFGTLLNENDWPQPEGFTKLGPNGSYLISSEGKKAGFIANMTLVRK